MPSQAHTGLKIFEGLIFPVIEQFWQRISQGWVPGLAGRFQITVSGLVGKLSGVGRQTHITSADRLFYLQLSCSMP